MSVHGKLCPGYGVFDGVRLQRFVGAFGVAAVLALLATFGQASARDGYVQDDAHLLSPQTVDALNRQIAGFHSRTGKEIVVVSVPSLTGTPLRDAVERTFAQQQVNGVLIFLAQAERQDAVIGDTASRGFFPAGTFADVHDAMRSYFRNGDFNGGVTTGVNLVVDQYRGHLTGARAPVAVRHQSAPSTTSSIGGAMFFWLILILLAGFLIIRAIFRAIAGRPRMMPPGYGGPGAPGAPGYGPPPGYGYGGYGRGMGYGGGSGFFSGLLGGLGGAFIGNELFGNHGGGFMGGGQQAGIVPDGSNAPDQSGWQSDPGQADPGNMGGGDWGSGGGGDWGGGGGGDWGGGGGGDSGGGW